MVERIRLSNDMLAVEIVPAWGARLTRLQALATGSDLLRPIEGKSFSPLHWPKGGLYPLVPYSNRLRAGTLRFDRQHVTLPAHPDATPHTLHGVAHTLAWDKIDASSDTITLALRYEGPHWPFVFAARQVVSLAGASLRLQLSATNLSSHPMPAGVGMHPYFPFSSNAKLSFTAGERWAIDAACLPTGVRERLDAPVTVTRHDAVTHDYVGYFSGWKGVAIIEREDGVLTLSAGPRCSHLVVFASAGLPYVCVEPATHVADGFNLAARGMHGTGTVVLQPRETLEEAAEFGWQPH